MKKYEEFTQESSDVVASGLQKLLAKEVVKALEPILLTPQLLGKDTSLVGAPGKTKTFRKRTAIEASPFAEGADIPTPPTDITYSTVDATPTKFGVGDTITDDAIDEADFNIIKDTKEACIDAMARKQDSRNWITMLDITAVDDEAVGTGDGATTEFQLDNAKVVEVTEVTVNAVPTTAYEVDYMLGWLKFDTAPGAGLAITADYKHSGRNAVEVTTAQTIAYKDLVKGKTKIRTYRAKPDTIVTDEEGAGQLLVDDKFLDASAYGDKVVMNGEIGKVAGCRVLDSEVFYTNVVAVLKKGSDLGYKVYKKMLTSKVDKLEKKAGDIFMGVYEKSIATVVNDELICLILNGQADAYAHT